MSKKVFDEYETDDFPSNKIWKGRIKHMLESSLPAVIESFQKHNKVCTKDNVKESLSLPNLIALSKDEAISTSSKERLLGYLETIPDFNVKQDEQSETASHGHGFLQMNATSLMNQMDSSVVTSEQFS